jgi:hypothetical protein
MDGGKLRVKLQQQRSRLDVGAMHQRQRLLVGPALPVGFLVGNLLASPYLSVTVFLMLAGGALGVAYGWWAAGTAMIAPFALLAVNLTAAIATRPRFRADLPLLLFHLSLLVLVMLFGTARLTYFDGAASLTRGVPFDGILLHDERGPRHPDRLGELRIAHEGFTERFPARGDYVATFSRVRWWDSEGDSHVAEIGDDWPLLLAGYRIYPTQFRGYSPLFHWAPDVGEEEYGTVQLSVDPKRRDFQPSGEWQVPGGPVIWAALNNETPLEAAPGTTRADLGAEQIRHHLVVRRGERRQELRPGEKLRLDTGTLTYVQLDSWMTYRITYDPTKPWLVSTVALAVGSLVWFYARRFRTRKSGSES